jgi:hypothetical protein
MRQKIIDIATAEIGVKESPAGSNKCKYNTWLYGKEVSGSQYAWCGAFVSWVFDQAGINLGNIDYYKGYAGTNYAVNNVHKWGKKIDHKDARPGDIAFFDWDKNKRWDHTGIFVKHVGDDIFETIEGNTAIGNDSNGGAVMRRQRRYSVTQFVRPNVLDIKDILV